MPPLPNTLYTRDTTCWLYGGVTLNPLYFPARHDETLLMKAVYQFHPAFVGSTVWWGDPERHWGRSTIEGGDVMPVGNGTVLVGMSERTSRQGITQLAAALFAQGAAERVVVAGMPRLRAAMHLDTVFTFADRDVVTLYPKIVDAIHSFTLRPADGGRVHLTDEGSARFVDVVAGALWACPGCASSRPAVTPTRPSASSGTAGTTRSPSSRASCSRTTATPRPTPCCARRASRCWRSAGRSWGAGAAAGTA